MTRGSSPSSAPDRKRRGRIIAGVTAPGSRLRLIALLSVAAWCVHELRYAVAFGGHSAGALQASGHGYLDLVCPLVGLLVLAAVGQLLHAVARRHARAGHRAMSLPRSWALLTAALVAIFTAQELLEGALSTGHAPGVAGLVGSGGWLALPAAALAGLLCALVLREAGDAVQAAAVPAPGLTIRVARATSVLVRVADPRPHTLPLARHLAGRGPPVLVPR